MVRQRGAGDLCAAASAIGFICLCVLTQGTGAIRPSDHGLAFQNNSTPADAPAMAAFFQGEGGNGTVSEARNTTSSWAAGATPLTVEGRKNRLRTVLLTVAVATGGGAVALLAGTAVLCVLQTRREKARQRRRDAASTVCRAQ